MDNIIKQSIEGRKNAIFNSYEVTDKVMINKIDDLFNRINDFGEKYKFSINTNNKNQKKFF